MDTWMQPAGEINLQGITSAAVHGRRRSLGGAANSGSCGIPPRQALMKISRGPPVGSAGNHFWAESREQSYSDVDDLELATDNLDDSLSLPELQSVYHLPSKDAARSLNVSLSRLKRSCRTHNLLRWPHRKLSSLRNLQETIAVDKNMKLFDKQRILQQIVNEIAAVRANPDHTIDPRLDEIRQAKYKLKYYHKTKHLHASVSAATRKRRHSSGCTEQSLDFSHNCASAASAPTATTATLTATYAHVGPQQLSLSLPSTGPQPAGADAPFAASARPPVPSTSLHTTANAPDGGAITTVGAVIHGGISGGGSFEHRLALTSPAAAPRFASDGAYSHGGGFGLYGAGSARCSVDGGGSGGFSVRDHSSTPGVLSTSTLLTGRPRSAIPPLTAGRLSEPNAGTGRMAAPMWSFPPLSRQSGSPPSASSDEVHFVLQQHHQEQQLQQRRWQHLHQHELLQWEQHQVQLEAVRRHSVGIMDETSGAVHPLPVMSSCGRQSATSLDGGTVPAADGAPAGSGRGAAVSHAGSHNTIWTLTPPTTQPAMTPPQTQNSFRTWVVHQAPPSSPPASSDLAAGAGCADGMKGGGDPAMQFAGNVSGAGELGISNNTFPLSPEAPLHSAVDLQPPSGPVSGIATFGGHALLGTIGGAHGGASNPAQPSMPYSHGVVNTSCPPPRCSSTGDPQVAAQLARQASAPHPSYTSTGCGGGGFSGGGSSCSGFGVEMYGGSAGALGDLHDGVNRGRFHSADGLLEVQKASGLPPRQSQTGDKLPCQAAAAAAALGANAGAGGSSSGAGRSGGTMFRFEACMGISLSHGAMAPSWYVPEAPARIAGRVPEPAAATAAPFHGVHIPFAQKMEARLDPQAYQAQWPHQRNEQQQQQQPLEHVRQLGHCSHTQPLPLNMAPALGAQLAGQHPHPDMHQVQEQQQQQNVYFRSLSSGAGGGEANFESRPYPTPRMFEAAFSKTPPYAEYGGDGAPASAAARRSTLDKVSAASGYLAAEAVGGASAGLQPSQRRGVVVSAAVATGVTADASYSAGAFAATPVATAAATGASFTAEVRFGNSSGAITTSGAVGRQEKMSGLTMIGAGNSGTAGSEFLRSASGGSNRASGMPTGVATLAASGLTFPSAAAASPPGRAITTGVPPRWPSAAIRTPSGAAQYPFPGFADAMACVGADWNSRGRGRGGGGGGGGGADAIPSRQEQERGEVLSDIPLGQMPQPPPPSQQQQPKHQMQQMQGQAQQQKEMQQHIPQFNFAKGLETCGGSFSFDRASVVTAPSGAAEANAFPGAVPAVEGAEAAAGRSSGGVDMTGSEQAASGELGSGVIGSGPAAALLVSLDWLLD